MPICVSALSTQCNTLTPQHDTLQAPLQQTMQLLLGCKMLKHHFFLHVRVQCAIVVPPAAAPSHTIAMLPTKCTMHTHGGCVVAAALLQRSRQAMLLMTSPASLRNAS
eukprot:GHRQ01036655.1.p1 GENE.GHRQ01036655.1~~GHRQ01036655.1.p1  ORF type:complete len:108 (-),score=17.21 GHRQ01036655.1:367-690(-)